MARPDWIPPDDWTQVEPLKAKPEATRAVPKDVGNFGNEDSWLKRLPEKNQFYKFYKAGLEPRLLENSENATLLGDTGGQHEWRRHIPRLITYERLSHNGYSAASVWALVKGTESERVIPRDSMRPAFVRAVYRVSQFLERLGFIYHDLHPNNLLVTEDAEVVLVDVDSAVTFDEAEKKISNKTLYFKGSGIHLRLADALLKNNRLYPRHLSAVIVADFAFCHLLALRKAQVKVDDAMPLFSTLVTDREPTGALWRALSDTERAVILDCILGFKRLAEGVSAQFLARRICALVDPSLVIQETPAEVINTASGVSPNAVSPTGSPPSHSSTISASTIDSRAAVGGTATNAERRTAGAIGFGRGGRRSRPERAQSAARGVQDPSNQAPHASATPVVQAPPSTATGSQVAAALPGTAPGHSVNPQPRIQLVGSLNLISRVVAGAITLALVPLVALAFMRDGPSNPDPTALASGHEETERQTSAAQLTQAADIHLDQLLVDAQQYLSQGRLDQSEARLREVLALRPDNFNALLLLSHVLYRLKKYDDAVAAAEQAVLVGGQSADAHNALGLAYEATKRYDLADGEYNRALEISPDEAVFNFNRGTLYVTNPPSGVDSLTRWELARDLLRRAREDKKNVPPSFHEPLEKAWQTADEEYMNERLGRLQQPPRRSPGSQQRTPEEESEHALEERLRRLQFP